MSKRSIKDLSINPLELTLDDGSISYAVSVGFKEKGLMWGWNERVFIMHDHHGGVIPDFSELYQLDRGYRDLGIRPTYLTFDSLDQCKKFIQDLHVRYIKSIPKEITSIKLITTDEC